VHGSIPKLDHNSKTLTQTGPGFRKETRAGANTFASTAPAGSATVSGQRPHCLPSIDTIDRADLKDYSNY
jgi:hypothetical protein